MYIFGGAYCTSVQMGRKRTHVSPCVSFPLFFFFFLFWPHHATCKLLVSQPGIEPASPALEVHSLNHWTARKVPVSHC